MILPSLTIDTHATFLANTHYWYKDSSTFFGTADYLSVHVNGINQTNYYFFPIIAHPIETG